MRSSLFIVLLVIFSCNHPQPKPTGTTLLPWNTQLEQVMSIHDEVMPFTSEIVKLNKVLKSYEASHPNLSKDTKTRLNAVQKQLTHAEESMWDWMHGFVQPNEKDDPKKVGIYLSNEQKKIQAVSQQMKQSMKSAKELISDLKIQQ